MSLRCFFSDLPLFPPVYEWVLLLIWWVACSLCMCNINGNHVVKLLMVRDTGADCNKSLIWFVFNIFGCCCRFGFSAFWLLCSFSGRNADED